MPRTLGSVKKIDLKRLREAAAISPRLGRCAIAVGVSGETLAKRLKDTPAVREAFDGGAHEGLCSIERAGFNLALEGDASMIKFLLRQRDPEVYCAAERNVKATETNASVNVKTGEAKDWLQGILSATDDHANTDK